MSLLIKALSRAEQGKTSGDPAAGEPLSLEPQSISGQPPRNAERGYASDRAAAATLMQANPRVLGISPATMWVLGVVLLLALLSGYFLYDYLQSLGKPDIVLSKAMPSDAPVTSANLATSPDGAQEQTPAGGSNATSTQTEPGQAGASAFASPGERTQHSSAGQDPISGRQSPNANADIAPVSSKSSKAVAAPQFFGAAPELPASSSINISRSNSAQGLNPNLSGAYKAWQAGDLVSAQRQYRQVLQADSGNVDALLGMAAVALKQGRQADARGWYGKVLELDPRNSAAQAALIGISEEADPQGSESALKNLLAQQPESANLHAMLGNLYASQQQWSAAQQAYFQAHHFAPDNVDYLFNLAVSLDQMGKPALALQYYTQTLQRLAISGGSQVDRAQLQARIAQLQP